jgi:hypothetical protein
MYNNTIDKSHRQVDKSLVKCNLGRFLSHIYILEEGSVHVVSLLLDGGAKFEKLVGNRLVGALENVDQAATRTS